MVEIEEMELLHDRMVALTRVGEMIVSTIRLREGARGLDDLLALMSDLFDFHERADFGAPGDYESMVFSYAAWTGGGIGLREFDFRRYETEDEARQGHRELVEKWKEMPAIRQDDA